MSSPLKQNTTTIQELLNTINSLPDAGKIELPSLSNEGAASDLLSGKEMIDGDGNKVTGTFTIDSELTTQDSLISQIQTALQNKAAVTGEDVTTETDDYTAKLAILERAIIALETELQGKASGSGADFETSVVTLSTPTHCQYLGTDFQPKSETTSTFETVKNSIVFIHGRLIGGSGYSELPSGMPSIVVRLTEAIVNITIAASGSNGSE